MQALRRFLKGLAFGLVGTIAFVAVIQLVPYGRAHSNPPVVSEPAWDSPRTRELAQRACFDCHSNETKWPLYARIAPGSWLMARDIHNGRNHLNFSEWADVDDDEKKTDLENCWEQVESGEMPKWFYVYPLHLGARLSDADKALLKGFFLKHKAEGAKPEKAEKPDAKE